jgi:hypothetical protein
MSTTNLGSLIESQDHKENGDFEFGVYIGNLALEVTMVQHKGNQNHRANAMKSPNYIVNQDEKSLVFLASTRLLTECHMKN